LFASHPTRQEPAMSTGNGQSALTGETSTSSATSSASPVDAATPIRPACQLCGRDPAVKATFRKATGLVIIHRTRTWRGSYCRDCGLTLYRNAQRATLIGGWWGLFSLLLFTPFTLVANAVNGQKVKKLPTPIALEQNAATVR
jgi:hypothetical protein